MRQEVYRVAYDEAHAELTEILGKFEQLRVRKDRIEKVVEALKPLLSTATISSNGALHSAAPVEAGRWPSISVLRSPRRSCPLLFLTQCSRRLSP